MTIADLTPKHAELLKRSAISDEVAEARGYRTMRAEDHLTLLAYGFGGLSRNRLPGLLIPLYDVHRQRWGYQLRPDHPRKAHDKLVKYETPRGQDVRLDVPPWCRDDVCDEAVPLIVTEGSRKADAAASVGYCAVAVLGVTMWHTPDWQELPLKNRDVYLAFDSDAATNPQVNKQLRKLAAHLRTRGANVATVQLPAGEHGAKVGLDDFLAAGGDLGELMEEAEPDADVVVGPPAGETRPPLDVTNDANLLDWLRAELGRGVPGLFLRGDELVRVPTIGEDGYEAPDDDRDDGPAQVRSVDSRTLRAMIQNKFWTHKIVQRNDVAEVAHTMASGGACDLAVAGAADSPNLPRLVGVVHTPLVRRTGKLLDQPGYDAESRLLYLPNGLRTPAVPPRPSRADIAAARDLLLYMVQDFPFATPHDRANYLGALLMPLLRVASPGLRPLVVINAAMQGSGKSLLAHLMRIVHGGVMRPELPNDDDELRKQITSVLRTTTGPVVHFDNATRTLRSGNLAALLTSNTWTDRVLGKSEDVTLPNDRLWVVTGNNVSLGGDLPRRALWVTIDPNHPCPWERRGWAEPNLLRWAEGKRGELIAALLTLVRAWVRAWVRKKNRTMLMLPGRGEDNFYELAGRVGGILQLAGIEGVFWHRDTERAEVGADDEDWAGWLAALHALYGDRTFTARDVINAFGSGLEEHAPAELVDKWDRSIGTGAGVAKSLGKWFGNRDGRWAGGYAVRHVGATSDGAKRWKVVAAG